MNLWKVILLASIYYVLYTMVGKLLLMDLSKYRKDLEFYEEK